MKRDERREDFRREKILVGRGKACEKRPVSADALERLSIASSASSRTRARRRSSTLAIGERVLDELVRARPARGRRASRRCSATSRTPRTTPRSSRRPPARSATRERRDDAMRRAMRPGARRASARAAAPSRTRPVGAVVFRGDRVLGRGAHAPVGGAARGGRRDRGARAPPRRARRARRVARRHARAVLATSAARPVRRPRDRGGHRARAASDTVDPHPAVAGRGMARAAPRGHRGGRSACSKHACREQHRGFLCVLRAGSPVRGAEARRHARRPHRDRAAASRAGSPARPRARSCTGCARRADACWSASGTALADDPELTARARRARRASAGAHRRRLAPAPAAARAPAPRRAGREPGYSARAGARARGAGALEARGRASVRRRARRGSSRPAPRRCGCLAQGRARPSCWSKAADALAAALLREGLVDELHWFVAPLLIGGDGRPALGALEVRSLAAGARRLAGWRARRIGSAPISTCRGAAARRESRSGEPVRRASTDPGASCASAIVVSRFNHLVSVRLLEGCHERLLERGGAARGHPRRLGAGRLRDPAGRARARGRAAATTRSLRSAW